MRIITWQIFFAVVSIVFGTLNYFNIPFFIIGRVIRNGFLQNTPIMLPTSHAPCSDELIANSITMVVSVKDTCTQTPAFFAHMATVVPRDIDIMYVYPNFTGCNMVDLSTSKSLFKKFKAIMTPATSSPIDGFLLAQSYINTTYALLLHNDCYLMETEGLCELYRALESHPESEFAAPQIFERSGNGIIVPHGHHKNLHVNSASGVNTISYDIDFDLMTRRTPGDFLNTEGPQLSFMEDHAYLARSNTYHLYLDANASHTLEYLDNVMSMRANATYPWYVPSSRFVFDVDIKHVGWKDVPYFSYKRSEEVGTNVVNYLNQKWGVHFPLTGIWNYVRYTMFSSLTLDYNNLPSSRHDQFALFCSWFESIGFNRYNGLILPELLKSNEISNELLISRSTSHDDAASSTLPYMIRRDAKTFLPTSNQSKIINITLGFAYIPIYFNVSNDCAPVKCGMLLVGQTCHCYTYHSPFSSHTYGFDKILELFKFPSRILHFVQMKYTTKFNHASDVICEKNQPCHYIVKFPADAKLVKWGWSA